MLKNIRHNCEHLSFTNQSVFHQVILSVSSNYISSTSNFHRISKVKDLLEHDFI